MYLGVKESSRKRGYSLVELGVSIMIFSIIAGIVTVAVGRSQMTLANNKFARLLEGRLGGLVEEVGSANYLSIVQGTFEKPKDPGCPVESTESCVMLGTRDFTVTWTITPSCLFNCLETGDLLASSIVNFNEISQQVPYAVLIKASVELPGESPVAYSKLFINPSIGADGYGLVRVNFADSNYNGPVYLVSSSRQVLSGTTSKNGVALLSGLVEVCTADSPCYLALNSSGSTRRDNVTLDYATAVEGTGSVVLSQDSVSEVGATLIQVSPVQASLWAVNADGRGGYASDLNSVCQGLRIPTTNSQNAIAVGCNSLQSSHIAWETYFPTSDPLVELAIPLNVPLSFVSITSEEPCIIPTNQVVYEQNVWVPFETCGNYSWGDPNLLKSSRTASATSVASGVFYRNDSTTTAVDLIWDGSVSQTAAAGIPSGQVWGSPQTLCSDCARVVLPVLAGPRMGTYKTLSRFVQPGESFFMDLEFINSDNPYVPFQVKVTNAPYGLRYLQDLDCELDCEGDAVSINDIIVVDGTEFANFTFEFIADDYFESDYLGLEFTNAYGTSTFNINLVAVGDDNLPLEMYVSPVSATQGGTYTADVLVVGTYGEGVTGVGESITLDDEGTTMNLTSVEERGDGWYTISGNILNVAAGTYPYTLSIGYIQAQGNMAVGQKIGSISGENAVILQNGNITVNLTAEDLAGYPMAGASMWVDVLTDELESVIGAYPTVRGCKTTQTGTCAVSISAESSVKIGNYLIKVYSDSLQAQHTLEVQGVLSSIEYSPVVTRKGSTTGIRVRTLDARGEPIAGVTLSMLTPLVGVTFTATESDALGYADVSLQTTVSTPTGINTLSLGYQTGTASLIFIANSIPDTIVASRVVLEQGTSTLTTVYVYDILGAPVAGAVVNTSLTGLAASTGVITDQTGAATILVSAGATSVTGVRYMDVYSTDGVTQKVVVQVVLGVNAIASIGNVSAGLAGPVTWTLYSGSGSAMAGVPYSIASYANGLVFTSNSGVTNAEGKIVMTVGTTSSVVKGYHSVVFNVAGKTLTSKIVVD